MATGSLSLDDISRLFQMLEVRCGNCTRSGRLRIDKLIDEYGRDMSLPDLHAAQRADELLAAGDMEGRAVWHRIERAIDELRRTVLNADEALH